MKKNLSAFVVGFGAGVIQVVPVAKSFSCCLILPVAAVLALSLDRKASGDYSPITFNRAAVVSILTGLWAALFGTFFDLFITFVTHNNDIVGAYGELQKLVSSFPFQEALKQQVSALLNQVVVQIKDTGFSWLYAFSALINNLILDILFAFIGGVVGMRILNSRSTNFPNNKND